MAIRVWYWSGLQRGRWLEEEDRGEPPVHLRPLLAFPKDYHLFIITIYQQPTFEALITAYPQLTIHYQQKKPSVSYRYPTQGPKLVTYILKHKDNV